MPVGLLSHLLVPLQRSSSRLVTADDGFNRPVCFRTGGGVFLVSLFTLRSLLYVFVLLALHFLSSCCQGRDDTHRQHTSDGTDGAHIMGCVQTLGGEGSRRPVCSRSDASVLYILLTFLVCFRLSSWKAFIGLLGFFRFFSCCILFCYLSIRYCL